MSMLPSPAIAVWSSSTAFSGARRRAERGGQVGPASASATSGPSRSTSGSSRHAGEPPRVVEPQSAQHARSPSARAPSGPTGRRRTRRRRPGRRSCSCGRGASRPVIPKWTPSGRRCPALGVDTSCLPRRRERRDRRAAHQLVDAVTDHQRIGVHDRTTGRPPGASTPAPGQLDLQHLGHGAVVARPARRTRHTASTMVAIVFTDAARLRARSSSSAAACSTSATASNRTGSPRTPPLPHHRPGARPLRSTPIGRRREVRVRIDEEAGPCSISRKRSLMRPSAGVWVVDAKCAGPAPQQDRVRAQGDDRLGDEPRRPAHAERLEGGAAARRAPRHHRRRRAARRDAVAHASRCARPAPPSRRRLRKLPMLQKVRQRTHQLIEVDQEGVVAVR